MNCACIKEIKKQDKIWGLVPLFYFLKSNNMKKIKLSEALTEKIKLQELINEKEEFIISNNKKGNKTLIQKELNELKLLRDEYIKLKLIINKANLKNYENIFRLSELKEEKRFLKSIDTNEINIIKQFQKIVNKDNKESKLYINKDFVISKIRKINKEITSILEKIEKFNDKETVEKI